MMAGPEKKWAEVSTQTVLCTPPSTIYKDLNDQGMEASSSSSGEGSVVYSTYKRKGKESLLKDMVVRALPVVENLDQRRRMAQSAERR